jgi:hypothetical protein
MAGAAQVGPPFDGKVLKDGKVDGILLYDDQGRPKTNAISKLEELGKAGYNPLIVQALAWTKAKTSDDKKKLSEKRMTTQEAAKALKKTPSWVPHTDSDEEDAGLAALSSSTSSSGAPALLPKSGSGAPGALKATSENGNGANAPKPGSGDPGALRTTPENEDGAKVPMPGSGDGAKSPKLPIKPVTPETLKQSIMTILAASKTQLDLIDVVLGNNTTLRDDPEVKKSMDNVCCVLKPGSGPGSSGSGSSDSNNSNNSDRPLLFNTAEKIPINTFTKPLVEGDGWCFWRALIKSVTPTGEYNVGPPTYIQQIVEQIIKMMKQLVNSDAIHKTHIENLRNNIYIDNNNTDEKGWPTQKTVNRKEEHIDLAKIPRSVVKTIDDYLDGFCTFKEPSDTDSGPLIWGEPEVFETLIPEIFNAKLMILVPEGTDGYKIPVSSKTLPIYKYVSYIYMVHTPEKNHFDALLYDGDVQVMYKFITDAVPDNLPVSGSASGSANGQANRPANGSTSKPVSRSLKELQGEEAMAQADLEKAKIAAGLATGTPEAAAENERLKAAEGRLAAATQDRTAAEAAEAEAKAAADAAAGQKGGEAPLTYTPEEIKEIEAKVQQGLDPKKWMAGVVESPENAKRFGVPLYSIMYQPLEENGSRIQEPVKERPSSTNIKSANISKNDPNKPANKPANISNNDPNKPANISKNDPNKPANISKNDPNKPASTPTQPGEEELLGGGKRLRRSRRKTKVRS